MSLKTNKIGIAVLTVGVFLLSNSANAAEGAASHYLPGVAGDILIAQSPKPGWQAATTLWYQRGDVSTAVVQGRIEGSLDLDLFLILPGVSYTSSKRLLGATYTTGIAIPFGYAELDAKVKGPQGRTVSGNGDSFNLSDIAVTPLQLNWQAGDFSFKFAEAVFAPTGDYDENKAVNLGRNYWSFDTIGAVSWFNKDTGTGIDFAPGIMANTENTDTDYRTGTEYHADFSVNQFLSESFVLGLRGYHYQQISGDGGSGARLGDFKSESYGIGPGFVWIPKSAKGSLTILGKWMHDLDADNRFESDYFTLASAWKF